MTNLKSEFPGEFQKGIPEFSITKYNKFQVREIIQELPEYSQKIPLSLCMGESACIYNYRIFKDFMVAFKVFRGHSFYLLHRYRIRYNPYKFRVYAEVPYKV